MSKNSSALINMGHISVKMRWVQWKIPNRGPRGSQLITHYFLVECTSTGTRIHP